MRRLVFRRVLYDFLVDNNRPRRGFESIARKTYPLLSSKIPGAIVFKSVGFKRRSTVL